jgi:hypothetical protein
MTKIDITAIRLDGGTQSRAELNKDTIAEYAEAIVAGSKFPEPVVFHDGDRYWLADGFHRVHAHKKADRVRIDVDLRQGTLRDAILFSVGANKDHGLRRTNADKRRAVEMLLRDDEWAEWSDIIVANKCCVSRSYVQQLRGEQPATMAGSRTGQDGKTRALPALKAKPQPKQPEQQKPEAPMAKLRLVEDKPAESGSENCTAPNGQRARLLAEVAGRDEKILSLLSEGLMPNEIASQLGCKVRHVHEAKERRGLTRVRVNPLRSLFSYAVEFTDTWQDAMSDEERWSSATGLEISELVTQLESLVFVTKTMIRSFKKQATLRENTNEHEPIRKAEPEKD